MSFKEHEEKHHIDCLIEAHNISVEFLGRRDVQLEQTEGFLKDIILAVYGKLASPRVYLREAFNKGTKSDDKIISHQSTETISKTDVIKKRLNKFPNLKYEERGSVLWITLPSKIAKDDWNDRNKEIRGVGGRYVSDKDNNIYRWEIPL